ncbi:acyl-CoA N-acyltransferase [Pluteus cervinus]|uniref:Acyl-CoA N-acyltransferase n=1 Tax=Pluteus cervinus TaxID=181527 RepID=A0ACD3B820_9AGAR|nr:acyl-CoA N-acyltransferase [Pluteus cervinus]
MPPASCIVSKTGRLQLITPPEDDSEDNLVALLRTHPFSRKYLQFFPDKVTVEEMRDRRVQRSKESRIRDFHIHTLDDEGHSQFVGITGIFNIDLTHESCEMGIMVDPDQSGKGVATDALYTLLEWAIEEQKMHRITFETTVNNAPMRHWLEKIAGARLEAERKECWKVEERKYADVAGYCILDWEWRERVKVNLQRRLNIRSAQ